MNSEIKKIIIDVDDTLTFNSSSSDYNRKKANLNMFFKEKLLFDT